MYVVLSKPLFYTLCQVNFLSTAVIQLDINYTYNTVDKYMLTGNRSTRSAQINTQSTQLHEVLVFTVSNDKHTLFGIN